jgi:hypothetical protein
MALRVAFLERSARDGRWRVGPPVVDPELEEMTLEEWQARIVANGHDLDEVTRWRTFWWAVAAHRLAPDARVFAIYGHHGLAVSLVWESLAADLPIDPAPTGPDEPEEPSEEGGEDSGTVRSHAECPTVANFLNSILTVERRDKIASVRLRLSPDRRQRDEPTGAAPVSFSSAKPRDPCSVAPALVGPGP